MKIKKYFASVSISGLMLFPLVAHAVFQEGVTPPDSDGGLIDVAAGTDKYVAVGLFTKVMHSTDGVNWVTQSVPDNGMTSFRNFRDIIYGGGRFIGTTQQSVIYSSTDGENWTDSVIADGGDLTAAAYNGSHYFVTGNVSTFDNVTFQTTFETIVLQSSDGTNWTEVTRVADIQAQSLAWNGSLLLMGTNSGDVLTSADSGATWAKQTDVIAANDVVTAFASNLNDLTIATGWHRSLLVSANGLSWTEVDHRKTNTEIIYGWGDAIWTGSEFIITDDNGVVARSSDGNTWTDDETFMGSISLTGVASIGDQVVAVGRKDKPGGGGLPAVIYEGTLMVNSNSLPLVNAGSDQTVTANTTVSLSGTASDSDGSISTYLWEQTAGTSVVLSATDSVDSSFTAPDVSAAETLSFRFTATDDAGGSGSDTIDILVEPLSNSGDGDANSGDTNNGGSDTDNSSGGSSSGSSGGASGWWVLLTLSLLTLLRRKP